MRERDVVGALLIKRKRKAHDPGAFAVDASGFRIEAHQGLGADALAQPRKLRGIGNANRLKGRFKSALAALSAASGAARDRILPV